MSCHPYFHGSPSVLSLGRAEWMCTLIGAVITGGVPVGIYALWYKPCVDVQGVGMNTGF